MDFDHRDQATEPHADRIGPLRDYCTGPPAATHCKTTDSALQRFVTDIFTRLPWLAIWLTLTYNANALHRLA
jgi:hypothetical protein